MNQLLKSRLGVLVSFLAIFAGACAPSSTTSTATVANTPVPPSVTLTPSATSVPPSATSAPPTITPTHITLTPDPSVLEGLLNTWEGSNGSYYLFLPDGTWHWDQDPAAVEKTPENTGDWWVEGNVIYVVDRTGPGKCPESFIGSYTAGFDGATLVLTTVHDQCGVRARQTNGRYEPLP